MGVVRVLVTTVLLSLFAVKYCGIKHGHKFNQYTATNTRSQTKRSDMLPLSRDFTERTGIMELLQLYVLFVAIRIIQDAKRKRNKTESFTTFFVFNGKIDKEVFFKIWSLIKGMLFPGREFWLKRHLYQSSYSALNRHRMRNKNDKMTRNRDCAGAHIQQFGCCTRRFSFDSSPWPRGNSLSPWWNLTPCNQPTKVHLD